MRNTFLYIAKNPNGTKERDFGEEKGSHRCALERSSLARLHFHRKVAERVSSWAKASWLGRPSKERIFTLEDGMPKPSPKA